MNERFLLRKMGRIVRVDIADLPKTLVRFKTDVEEAEKKAG